MLEPLLNFIFGGEENPSFRTGRTSLSPRIACYLKSVAEEKRSNSNSPLTYLDYDCINCTGYNTNCKRHETKKYTRLGEDSDL